jgi:DNA-binding IclR family transcriptional regulator
VAYTPTTIVDKAELVRELEATRLRGYAISRAEFTPGVMTIAAPVFDSAGRVSHVLQCPGLDSAVPSGETDVAELLIATASRIGPMLGSHWG